MLVFEDLHWADDALLDFVDPLVDWAVGVPLLIVVHRAARAPRSAARAGEAGSRTPSTISLSPLSDDETAQLVHALLARSLRAGGRSDN